MGRRLSSSFIIVTVSASDSNLRRAISLGDNLFASAILGSFALEGETENFTVVHLVFDDEVRGEKAGNRAYVPC